MFLPKNGASTLVKDALAHKIPCDIVGDESV